MGLDLINGTVQLTNHNDELKTAIIMSLFCDARASDEDYKHIKGWESSKKGYWANELLRHNLGSKLWILKRSPKNQETLDKAVSYAKESLLWLVEEKKIKSLIVTADYSSDILVLTITIDGNNYRFDLNG